MRMTFFEEIEIKKAWRECMTCPQCNEFKYKIHHQLQPRPEEWWIECENCGYETNPSPTRETAIMHWKQNR